MSEEVDLKSSSKSEIGRLIRQFGPILLNKDGQILDGKHRQQADSDWPKVKTTVSPGLQTFAARLILNTRRRVADTNDYNEFAKWLVQNEPGDKPYRVKSGKSIAERMSELTGIPVDTIREYLDDQYKGPQKAGVSPTSLGTGEQVRVPEQLAPEVKALVNQLKTTANANPRLMKEIIRATKARLRNHSEELNVAAKMPVELRSLVETGKLPLEIVQVIESKVPEKFLEAEAKHIMENRLNLEETESYLTVQETIYRLHEHGDKPERGKTRTPQIEFVKLNESKIRSRTGSDIDLANLELTTVSGKRVHLFEEIQHALRKLSPGDEAEITVIIWAKRQPIEAR